MGNRPQMVVVVCGRGFPGKGPHPEVRGALMIPQGWRQPLRAWVTRLKAEGCCPEPVVGHGSGNEG